MEFRRVLFRSGSLEGRLLDELHNLEPRRSAEPNLTVSAYVPETGRRIVRREADGNQLRRLGRELDHAPDRLPESAAVTHYVVGGERAHDLAGIALGHHRR